MEMMQKGNDIATAVHFINQQLLTHEEDEIEQWINNMFDKADIDKTDTLSLDEFLHFLRVVNKEERESHNMILRERERERERETILFVLLEVNHDVCAEFIFHVLTVFRHVKEKTTEISPLRAV